MHFLPPTPKALSLRSVTVRNLSRKVLAHPLQKYLILHPT